MSTNPGIFRFHGGLQLEDHKQLSLSRPLQAASLASELIIPLNQHIGEANHPLVKAGERVIKGQLLADSAEFVSAPVHAPAAGTIKALEPRPIAHPSGQQADCFILLPDAGDAPPEPTPLPAVRELSRQQLLEIIRAAGIVGLGGAVCVTGADATQFATGDAAPVKFLRDVQPDSANSARPNLADKTISSGVNRDQIG